MPFHYLMFDLKNKLPTLLYRCFAFALLLLWTQSVFGIDTEFGNNADQTIMALNPEMFTILEQQQNLYQQKLLATHPIIVALFNQTGGQFILYRPHQVPLQAPPLPEALDYKLAAAVQHSAMAAYELGMQGYNNPNATPSWQVKMQSLSEQIMLAQNNVTSLNVSAQEKHLFLLILNQANTFMTERLKQNTLSLSELNTYAQALKPNLEQLSHIIASAQVNYWLNIVSSWKHLLGPEWSNTYAVVLYIPVELQNNIFLNLLAHEMGQKTIHQRLFYFTSDSYTPTATEALDLLAKAMPDKSLANQIYGRDYLQDSSILSGSARQVLDDKH